MHSMYEKMYKKIVDIKNNPNCSYLCNGYIVVQNSYKTPDEVIVRGDIQTNGCEWIDKCQTGKKY